MRLGSSLRVGSADAAWARAWPLASRFGITRVTDITRIDHLGVPVYAAIRPRGQVLRVHAGKGLTTQEARIGALMEALEYAVAEAATCRGPDATLSLGEMATLFEGRFRLLDCAPCLGVRLPPQRVVGAIRFDDLARGGSCLLPWELAAVPTVPDDDAPELFGWSGNGLASGSTLEEATLHALLEVLERDAQAMNAAVDESGWVDPSTWPDPFHAWHAAWQVHGVDLIVRQLPNDFGLPCYAAYLHDTTHESLRISGGHGLHPDAGIALARAVCEAAQSRLTFIHGGWDCVGYRYEPPDDAHAQHEAGVNLLAELRDRTRQAAYDPTPWAACASDDPAEVLAALLADLGARGYPDVFRHRYAVDTLDADPPDGSLHVVRVVVPRCEYAGLGTRRMGPRLYQRMIDHD